MASGRARGRPDGPDQHPDCTDRLTETAALAAHVQRQGYYRQVPDYAQAITQQMGISPRVLLVFLNVGDSVGVVTGGGVSGI